MNRSRTFVTRFHQWVISTVNDDLPPNKDLSEANNELYALYNNMKLFCGKISVRMDFGKDIDYLKHQKSELEQQMNLTFFLFKQRKSGAEVAFVESNAPPTNVTHTCIIPFHMDIEHPSHSQKLVVVQRHKGVCTYYLRCKKRYEGMEYGQPHCGFGFPIDLATWYQIVFEKTAKGGVHAYIISRCNDPRLKTWSRQRCHLFLHGLSLE